MLYSGIIFDMDNTLLQSKINFKAMREDLIHLLVELALVEKDELQKCLTPSQIIEWGKQVENAQQLALEEKMWQIVREHEEQGLEGVILEEGVREGLGYLQEKGLPMAIVTNNSYHAACSALQQTSIYHYFGCVVGREQMESLKPSPSGILHVLQQFDLPAQEWVMLGDSWIDGKAAGHANVDFVSYKGNSKLMAEQGVSPVFMVEHFSNFVQWLG